MHIKIEYYQRILTIYYHGGLNNDLSTFEICTRVENVDLPKNGYFGVSAATGGLADDHDVISFLTHSLIDPKTVVWLAYFYLPSLNISIFISTLIL